MKFNDILKHEQKYLRLFSDIRQKPFGYEAEDVNQRDKYYHNLLFIQNGRFTFHDIRHYMEENKKYGFIVLRFLPKITIGHFYLKDYILNRDAFFGTDIESIRIPFKRFADVSVVDPNDESFLTFLFNGHAEYGIPYAKGNVIRQQEVLNNNKHCYHYYVIKKDDQVIGTLNAFFDGEVGKVDDFVIDEAYRKQGYGSQLMSFAIHDLKLRGIKYVYLVTDDEDTPKDMYQAWNFKLIGKMFELRKMFDKDEF